MRNKFGTTSYHWRHMNVPNDFFREKKKETYPKPFGISLYVIHTTDRFEKNPEGE